VAGINTPGVKAVRASQRANRWRHKKPIDPVIDPVLNRLEAEKADAEAAELLRPPERLLRGGNEAMRPAVANERLSPARNAMISTLEDPNMISVEASEQRVEAALGAGVLPSALDAAVSAKAENSLEKMLCHQMAGAHHAAMKLLAGGLDSRLPPVEQARLLNAAARLMQVYQEGLIVLQRIRSGGQQTVVVQHVHVSDGGQAVVAGKLSGGSQAGRRGQNGQ
jgi:predicted component of type VI protein secretion system